MKLLHRPIPRENIILSCQFALLTGLRTDFASSVWNFCRWIADVPPPETSAVRRLLLASKNYVLVLVVSLGHLWSNSPRSIDQNFNVTPRLYGQKLQNSHDTLLFRNSQKRLSTKKSNQISPRSHVGILIYRTWSIASGPPGHRDSQFELDNNRKESLTSLIAVIC